MGLFGLVSLLTLSVLIPTGQGALEHHKSSGWHIADPP